MLADAINGEATGQDAAHRYLSISFSFSFSFSLECVAFC